MGWPRKHTEILSASLLDSGDDIEIKIGDQNYNIEVMESDYDDSWQIGASEGDIIVFNLITYGYGEQITWEKPETQKKELEVWAADICERHNCKAKISVTANYW